MDPKGWNTIDADRSVLSREYAFGKDAYATMLVFRGAEGLVVLSPATKMDAAAFDALSEHGEVRALVATNTHHHLGQAEWRARFPNAQSYAAPAALARLRKKSAAIPYRSLDELALPDDVRADVLPGCNNGELLFRVGGAKGSIWYTGDILTNIERTPGPPWSWLFSWTDSGPGFRLFRLGVWLFVKDKPALKERLVAMLADDPPAVVVPGHGPPVVGAAVAGEAREQIARL